MNNHEKRPGVYIDADVVESLSRFEEPDFTLYQPNAIWNWAESLPEGEQALEYLHNRVHKASGQLVSVRSADKSTFRTQLKSLHARYGLIEHIDGRTQAIIVSKNDNKPIAFDR